MNGQSRVSGYRTDRRVTLPTTLEIAPRLSADGADLACQYTYDDGPKIIKSMALVRIEAGPARYSSRAVNGSKRDEYRITSRGWPIFRRAARVRW